MQSLREAVFSGVELVRVLAEECGELASEVNHHEVTGVKVARLGPPDRKAMAKEVMDVMRVALQLSLYYDLQDELEECVDASYDRMVGEGIIEPLTNQ